MSDVWQNVYPQLCHLLSFTLHSLSTVSTCQSQRLPTISHWKMVQHLTCFWVIFSMQYAEHITENESLQHTYVQSSFCFRLIFFVTLKCRLDWSMIVLLLGAVRNSVWSLRINHSSISGKADKPVRNKPKAKDRTLYKLAYELLCIPPPHSEYKKTGRFL